MNKLTKGIFVLMTASLAATAPISASANSATAVSKVENNGQIDPELMKKIEKNLEKLGGMLPYLKEYPITEVEIAKDSDWIWVNKYQSKEKKTPSLTFMFDSKTGECIRFNSRTGGERKKSTYPPEQAKEKAIQFMKVWYGEDMGGYQLIRSYGADALFRKLVNGIPFKNDNVYVQVDSNGQITGKGVLGEEGERTVVLGKETNIQFGDPKEALPKDQVEKLFVSYMKPHYSLDIDGKTFKLLYTPVYSGEIDARTGKAGSVPTNSKLVQFQPKGAEPKAKTKAEAAAFLAAKTGFDFTKERAVFEENSDQKETNYLWKTETGVIGSVYVDKKTGKINSYQVVDGREKKGKADKKLTAEQALKIAVAELSQYLKPDIKEMMLLGADRYKQYVEDKNVYSFNFSLTHDGIPVEEGMIQAEIDGATGKALSMHWRLPQQEGQLPDAKKAISPEEAAKIFLKQYPLELCYVLDEEKGETARLVYLLSGKVIDHDVDAITGQLYRYGGEQ